MNGLRTANDLRFDSRRSVSTKPAINLECQKQEHLEGLMSAINLVTKSVLLATVVAVGCARHGTEVSNGDPSSIPELITRLTSKEEEQRIDATIALQTLGQEAKPAIPTLINVMKTDPSPHLRSLAMGVLLTIASDRSNLTKHLIDSLNDPNCRVRIAAAEALFQCDPDNPLSLQTLALALCEGDTSCRDLAICTLGNLGTRANGSVPILCKTLSDANERLRRHSAYALGQIGADAQDAVPALVDALSDRNTEVRLYVAQALGKMGRSAQRAVPRLVQVAKEDESRVRIIAIQSLGKIGVKEPNVVESLGEALLDPDAKIRLFAAQSLGEIGDKAAVPFLVNALNDADVGVRRAAITTLLGMKPITEPAISALETALKDRDEFVREAAAEALKDRKSANLAPR
jgi:HEAT repeat protein